MEQTNTKTQTNNQISISIKNTGELQITGEITPENQEVVYSLANQASFYRLETKEEHKTETQAGVFFMMCVLIIFLTISYTTVTTISTIFKSEVTNVR